MTNLLVTIYNVVDLVTDTLECINPYVMILGGCNIHRTTVKHQTNHPKWNETFLIEFSQGETSQNTPTLSLTVWDYRDDIDDFLGYISIYLVKEQLEMNAIRTSNLCPRSGRPDQVHGSITYLIVNAATYKSPISSPSISLSPHPHQLPTIEDRIQAILDFTESIDSTQIDLSGCHITTLSESVLQVPEWLMMDLSFNSIMKWPHSTGNALSYLSELYLTQNQIINLDPNIFNLVSLHTLYLDENGIMSLPQEISKLINLKHLSLSKNNLRMLPLELSQLTNLESLWLNENIHLSNFPPTLKILSSLTKLDLHGCSFENFPSYINQLHQLVELDLSRNKLYELPDTFATMTNLQSLKIASNYLTDLPVSVAMCTKLRNIDIDQNPIQNIPLMSVYHQSVVEFKAYLMRRYYIVCEPLLHVSPLELGGIQEEQSHRTHQPNIKKNQEVENEDNGEKGDHEQKHRIQPIQANAHLPSSIQNRDKSKDLEVDSNSSLSLIETISGSPLSTIVPKSLTDRMDSTTDSSLSQIPTSLLNNRASAITKTFPIDPSSNHDDHALNALEDRDPKSPSPQSPPIDPPSLDMADEQARRHEKLKKLHLHSPDIVEDYVKEKCLKYFKVSKEIGDQLTKIKRQLLTVKSIDECMSLSLSLDGWKELFMKLNEYRRDFKAIQPPPLYPSESQLQQLKKISMVVIKEIEMALIWIQNMLLSKQSEEMNVLFIVFLKLMKVNMREPLKH